MRDFGAGWTAQAFAGISEFIGRITRCFLNCFGDKNMCEKKELSPQKFWFYASASKMSNVFPVLFPRCFWRITKCWEGTLVCY